MVIKCGPEWRIKSDEHSWNVQKYKGMRQNRETGEKEEQWEGISWHAELEDAVISLTKQRIRLIDSDDVSEILKRMGEIQAEIMESLDPFREWCGKADARRGEPENIVH